MKPETGEIVESLENLNVPVSATKFGYGIAVALDGNGSITLFNFDGSPSKVLADGFEAPTHVINYEEGLLVSDRGRGELVKIDSDGTKTILVNGLDSPEGIAVQGNSIFVFEGNTGEIKEILGNVITVIGNVLPGSPAQSDLEPPSMIFNGIVTHNNYLYIAGEVEKSLFRIRL